MVINFFVPDPIPVVDELIMGIGFIHNLQKAMRAAQLFIKIKEFVTRHKKLLISIGIGAVALTVLLIILI
jgi:hypothetical protein